MDGICREIVYFLPGGAGTVKTPVKRIFTTRKKNTPCPPLQTSKRLGTGNYTRRMIKVILVGMALGFYAAAMPGPINLEVIRRSISRGPRLGWTFGLGACLADVIFVLLMSFGALALFNQLPEWGKGIMWITGASILFVLGIQGIRARLPKKPASTGLTGQIPSQQWVAPPKVTVTEMVGSFALGLALTLSSLPTIMFWLITSAGVASSHLTMTPDENNQVPYLLAVGVGTACTLWVTGAVLVSARFHRNLKPTTHLWVERVAGVALCIFGTYGAIEAIKILWRTFVSRA